MKSFIYVYILQSELNPDRFYIGLTHDLPNRFATHNAGRCFTRLNGGPWRLKAYVALRDRLRAADFERYLKSASGARVR